ncbi:MAG: hypothetical protein HY332_14575 [Chloroflexi bacterium]|nr:hypothetical protein [Chloroflexota bacterium]
MGVRQTGITGAMQIAHMAAGFELPVAMMNCPGNFMAHLAAALPNHLMMEVLDNGREPCFTVDNRIEDGLIVLGDTPGLGITIDEAKLEQLSTPLPPRPGEQPQPFPRRRGAGLYVVPLTPEERAAQRAR